MNFQRKLYFFVLFFCLILFCISFLSMLHFIKTSSYSKDFSKNSSLEEIHIQNLPKNELNFISIENVLFDTIIKEEDWTFLDLSKYVGKRKVSVLLEIFSPSLDNFSGIYFRTSSDSLEYHTSKGINDSNYLAYIFIETDSEGRIEYKSISKNIRLRLSLISYSI